MMMLYPRSEGLDAQCLVKEAEKLQNVGKLKGIPQGHPLLKDVLHLATMRGGSHRWTRRTASWSVGRKCARPTTLARRPGFPLQPGPISDDAGPDPAYRREAGLLRLCIISFHCSLRLLGRLGTIRMG